jgi:predicted kinase
MITSLWNEGVAENVVEDSVLRKQGMRRAMVSLVHGHIVRCKLIFCYCPVGDNFCLV